jgi:hypothetical protein
MSQTAEKPPTAPPKKQKTNSYPWYSPRFWHGLRFGDWLALCARNGFRINPIRWPMAALITPSSIFNSCMAGVQALRHGRKIRATKIDQPPVFIIGHWRSGTTLLHELMVLDDRFAYPTTYECMAPHHYLLTEWIFRDYGNFLMPKQRPMDNMAAGWAHPQEDEFALLNLGVPSIYTRIAFPNNPVEYLNTLDMHGLTEKQLKRWCDALHWFVQELTYDKQKRIVLKSPPHTGRIEVLSKLFPGAKFIHIARNPYSIFPSTRRLWQSLDGVQALQWPRHRDLDEFVFAAFERMYRGYDAQRNKLDDAHLYELRYEDLVRNPAGEVQRIYEALDLGDFDVRDKITAHMHREKDYTPNRHELEPAIKAEIQRRWGSYLQRYGYT